MENSKLFQTCEQGYNCKQVDEYLTSIKTEYKKLFEYAKSLDQAVKSQREKASGLTAENEQLTHKVADSEKKILELETALAKAKNAPSPAAAPESGERAPEYDALIMSVSTMKMLAEEVVRENKELRTKLAAFKAGI